ncbi:Neprilysin-11 [Halotydeus destructor]|nr:Neprilysin-11 [Halotydeus destructor]
MISSNWVRGNQREMFTEAIDGYEDKGWWQKRSNMEKKLLMLCVLAALLTSAMAIVIVLMTVRIHEAAKFMAPFMMLKTKLFGVANKVNLDKMVDEIKRRNVCLTPGCVNSAARLLGSIDQSVDPCNDFYSFSCGKWIDNQAIDDDRVSASRFGALSDQVQQKLRLLLEHEDVKDEFYIKNAKLLYKTCLNETAINALGVKPLTDLLDSVGGWPMVLGDKWADDDTDIYEMIRALEDRGYIGALHSFLSLYFGPDLKNNTRYIMSTSEASLSLSREYMMQNFSDSVRQQEYYKLLVKSAEYLGAESSRAKKEAMEVLMFEKEIAKLTLPREEKRNFTRFYNKMTYKELKALEPNLPWDDLTEMQFEEKIKDTEEVMVYFPKFITGIHQLVNATDKRVLVNYLLWRAVDTYSSYLDVKFRDIFFEYSKKIYGVKTRSPRWKTCISSAKVFTAAVSSMYVKKHFKPESKTSVNLMVKYIRDEFETLIQSADWMDESTKGHGLAKLKAITIKMGFPEELLNSSNLVNMYKDIVLSPDLGYLESAEKISLWRKHWKLSFYRKPIDKNDWRYFSSVAEVNAYNHMTKNVLEFPAGILQGIFFDKDQPSYLNFGAIGSVIGHELTHSFDDRGRQMDKEGHMNNWWGTSTSEQFEKRAKCFEERYSNFTIITSSNETKHLKGLNTLGENIADNGGTKESFLAYKNFVAKFGEELPLPGLKYRPEQLFWIGFANVWCRKVRLSALESGMETGSHSPGRFRVLGVAQNSEHFAKAFNCPLNSPMNPAHKCSVW